MASPAWLELEGAVNVRDLAGLPTTDGGLVQSGRLVRADNLQDLTAEDIHRLVDELGVRSVVDLRTGVEVRKEGPGRLSDDPRVDIHHLSLFPEAGENTDAAAAEDGVDADVLPWQRRHAEREERRLGPADVYLGYLDQRPDSIVASLRTIAGSDGATVVHCAAGKDRTGVVVAFALLEVGVTREAVVADYARSAERIDALLERLMSTKTYSEDITRGGQRPVVDPDRHAPRAETMEQLLDEMDARFGGVGSWLRQHGWTDDDAAALRAKLIAP